MRADGSSDTKCVVDRFSTAMRSNLANNDMTLWFVVTIYCEMIVFSFFCLVWTAKSITSYHRWYFATQYSLFESHTVCTATLHRRWSAYRPITFDWRIMRIRTVSCVCVMVLKADDCNEKRFMLGVCLRVSWVEKNRFISIRPRNMIFSHSQSHRNIFRIVFFVSISIRPILVCV